MNEQMTRRQLREAVFRIVYMSDFYSGDEISRQAETFLSGEEIEGADREEIMKRSLSIVEKKPELDAMINEKTEGWKTSRMPKTDLSAIRVALYEALSEGLDKGICINEAVDIAKKYGNENSGSFVNGVLARLL